MSIFLTIPASRMVRNGADPITKLLRLRFLATLALALAISTAPALAQPKVLGSVGGRATVAAPSGPMRIVMCRPGVDIDAFIKEYGVTPKFIYRCTIRGFAAPLAAETIDKLKLDARVLSVEQDGPIFPVGQIAGAGIIRMGITNFPIAHIDGGNHQINVDIAVLDSGIQPDHPDLNVVQSIDLTGQGDGGVDWSGHGTAVSGVIAASDNDFGVVGVAPGARLWSVEVLSADPDQSTWSTALAGFEYVGQNSNQIAIANASFVGGGIAPYAAVHGVIQAVVNLGVVVVAGAGNSTNDLAGPDGIFGTDDDILPAALPGVMAVSAMDPSDDTIAPFSNFSSFPHPNAFVTSPGAAIDVAAPGVNILSTTTNSGYATYSGTSLAAPHVSGLVALYIAANGRATNAAGVYKIRQAIIDNSLAQSLWNPNGNPFNSTNNPTGDPDGNPEPLAIPSENWVPLPFIASQSNAPEGFQITFDAEPGYNYTAQSSDLLFSQGQWSNLSAVAVTGSVTTVTVPDSAPTTGNRFYRLLRQPAP